MNSLLSTFQLFSVARNHPSLITPPKKQLREKSWGQERKEQGAEK